MKKNFLLLFVALQSMLASSVEIDGVYYNLVAKVNIAEVIAGPYEEDDWVTGHHEFSGYYKGNVVIPEYVTYEGITYKVTSIHGGDYDTGRYVGAFTNCYGLKSLTIPKSVTSIGNGALDGCGPISIIISDLTAWCNIAFESPLCMHNLFVNETEIKELAIPNTLTSIGQYVFSGCRSLTSVSIPNSVTSIGESAFQRCTNLTSITIPNSVTSISNSAFYYCSSLASVTIPNSVTSIGDNAFQDCSSLTSVDISNSVTSISVDAFSGCTSLASVTIPTSVTTIGENAFQGCASLASVTIPNGVTTIGKNAFYKCQSLATVTIPNSVTTIGESAFMYCSGMTSISIPNSITSISKSTFQYCSSLTSITIPNSVTTIDENAFCGCENITSLTIGSNVTNINNYAFWLCSRITSVNISDLSAWFRISFGDKYSNPLYYSHRLFVNGTEVKDLIVPSGITTIRGYSFCNCKALTSVTIPDGVTGIGSSAFQGCDGLTSITLPKSVTTISTNTFQYCNNLTSVIIGSGIKTIYAYAFANCKELTNIYCYAEKVPYTKGTAFEGSYIEYATLHVPNNSINLYKSASPWSNFGTIAAIGSVSFNLTYMVDGEVYKSYEVEYGSPIVPEPAPTKEGYTFSGWSEIPETMPAHDVTVTGSFTKDIIETCATPTISYVNGELTFNSETEGVTFHYDIDIEDNEIRSGSSDKVQLSVTYHISVYATKEDYYDSEVATGTLCWIDQQPVTNGVIQEDAVAEVKALPVLIQSNGGTITVQGASEGTEIMVYGVNGMKEGSAIATKGFATINTSLQSGSTAIVRIGEKAVKVLVK